MDTFNFPYHLVQTDYPENGTRVQLNNNYLFTAPPAGPDCRTFTLSFPIMFYYTLADGVTIDLNSNPLYNMAVLESFYNSHKMYKSFYYPHRVYGNVITKFSKPLSIPKGIVGGNGALEDFQVTLMEVNQ